MFDIEKRVNEFYKYRKPDIRIVNSILSLLNLPIGSKIADIGAGYGKYSIEFAKRGYELYAIEPSTEMKKYYTDFINVNWIRAFADKIPLKDCEMDASVLILSIHHFSNLEKCLVEINRITKSKILIMTFDPQIYTKFWLFDYIPELKQYYFDCLKNINELKNIIANICKRKVDEKTFEIPSDCCDWFSASAWKRPEIFFDVEARKSMSPFSYIDEKLIYKGLENLKKDLDDKSFYRKYEMILSNNEIDIGCIFLVV